MCSDERDATKDARASGGCFLAVILIFGLLSILIPRTQYDEPPRFTEFDKNVASAEALLAYRHPHVPKEKIHEQATKIAQAWEDATVERDSSDYEEPTLTSSSDDHLTKDSLETPREETQSKESPTPIHQSPMTSESIWSTIIRNSKDPKYVYKRNSELGSEVLDTESDIVENQDKIRNRREDLVSGEHNKPSNVTNKMKKEIRQSLSLDREKRDSSIRLQMGAAKAKLQVGEYTAARRYAIKAAELAKGTYYENSAKNLLKSIPVIEE